MQKVKFDAPQPPPKPDLGSLLLESVYKLPQKKTKKTPGRMAKSLAKSRQGIKLPQSQLMRVSFIFLEKVSDSSLFLEAAGVPSTPPITLLNLANTPSAKRREETTVFYFWRLSLHPILTFRKQRSLRERFFLTDGHKALGANILTPRLWW